MNFSNPSETIPYAEIWASLLDMAEIAYLTLYNEAATSTRSPSPRHLRTPRIIKKNLIDVIDSYKYSVVHLEPVNKDFVLSIKFVPSCDDQIVVEIHYRVVVEKDGNSNLVDEIEVDHFYVFVDDNVDGDTLYEHEITPDMFYSKKYDFTFDNLVKFAVEFASKHIDAEIRHHDSEDCVNVKFSPKLEKKIVGLGKNEKIFANRVIKCASDLKENDIEKLEKFFSIDLHKYRGKIAGNHFGL